MPLVDQKLLTILQQLKSSPVLCRIHVDQYLIFCLAFVDPHLFFCPISFGHYIVCYSSIDLLLLVTSLVSSDVSHYTCSVIHNNLIFLYPFVKVDNNFRNMANNYISFVSNKMFKNLPQLTIICFISMICMCYSRSVHYIVVVYGL